MIAKSLSYHLLISLATLLGRWFKHSQIGKNCIKIGRFCSNLWQNSITRHIIFGNFAQKTGKTLDTLQRGADLAPAIPQKHISQSLILSSVGQFCGNLLHISLRSYGILLLLTGGIPSAASFLQNGHVPLLMGAVAALGVALLVLSPSFIQLYNGSFVMTWIGRFFHAGIIREKPRRRYIPIMAAIGVALGTAAYLLDLTAFFFLAGGTIGGLLIIYKTEIGIFAAALLMTVLPTMPILGLLAATVTSFVLKVAITGQIRLKFIRTDLFVLIFAAIIGFSLVISYNFASSGPVVAVYLLFIAFYFAVKNTINTRQKFFALLSLVAISGLFVAAFGIWQRLTGNFVMTQAWLDEGFFGETMVRIYSTLENPNVLGKYLIFIVLIAFGMIYYFKENLNKTAAAGILATAAVCLILTQSRGAWLGVIFALGIFALLRDRRLVALGLIGLAAAPFFIPPEVLTRFLSIGDLADTSTNFRLSIWLASLDMIRVFWPIGIGPGTENFISIYNLYAFSAAHALHSHNLYLQLIIDFGIAGLVTFLLIMGGFLKGLFMTINAADKAMATAAAILAAAMLGYLLQGFTDNVFYNFRVLGFFWLIVAMGAALPNLTTPPPPVIAGQARNDGGNDY